MSNKTQLQTNNTALDGYIARINAAKDVAAGLPEAGGGGSGGGNIETCTVTITCNDGGYLNNCVYTAYENNSFIPTLYYSLFGGECITTVTLNNVVCGSSIFIGISGLILSGYSCSGGVEFVSNGATQNYKLFKAPTVAGSNATITIYNND